MYNVFKKYDVDHIDMSEIKMDSFCESLLWGVAQTKDNCKFIDKRIKHIAKIPCIPYMKSLNHFDIVVDSMIIKRRLIEICDLFKEWIKGVNELKKKLYVAYFIKKSPEICHEINGNYKQHIFSMARDFMLYIKVKSDLDEKELLKNPFVYDSYIMTVRRNEKFGSYKGCVK